MSAHRMNIQVLAGVGTMQSVVNERRYCNHDKDVARKTGEVRRVRMETGSEEVGSSGIATEGMACRASAAVGENTHSSPVNDC
jgi:hypothetical protein